MTQGDRARDVGETFARPNRIPWPPLVFVAALVAAVLLGRFWPGPDFLDSALPRALGAVLLAGGLTLDLATMLVMTRHKANILPHRAATALVTSGPFALTRNPIYLGNTIALTGAGLAFANPWFVPAALAAATAVTRLGIVREEAHLAARFGAEWQAYARRTPRWLGW